jgi:hypothetical protein
VWVSPGQGVCAFCQRQKETKTASKIGVWWLAAFIAVAALAGAGFGAQRFLEARRLMVPSAEPTRAGVPVVVVTETALLLDGVKLLDLPSREEQVASGVGAAAKRLGPADLQITVLVAALEKVKREPQRPLERLECRFAPTMPYRLIMEILFSSKIAGFDRSLVSAPASSAGPAVSLEIAAPRRKSDPLAQPPALALYAIRDGFNFQLKRRQVGKGCQFGPGVVTSLDDAHAYETLADCVREIRRTDAIDGEPIGAVVANPGIPASTVLYLASTLHCGRRVCGHDGSSAILYSPIYFSVAR